MANNQTNAASVLRERIAQCESADILTVKDLTKMAPDALRKLLNATQPAWQSFSMMVKWKVWKHHAFNQLHEASYQDIFKTLSTLVEFQPVNFADGHDAFEIMQPSFAGLFQDFVMEVHSSMDQAGLLSSGSGDTIVGMNVFA